MSVRREQIVNSLIVVGFVAAFVAAVYLPGRSARQVLQAEIERAQSVSKEGELQNRQSQNVLAELARLDAYLKESMSVFTKQHEVLANVHRKAVGSRLKVVRLEPEVSRSRESYVEHPYRLEFRGSLGSLASFLSGLENDQRIYAVEELQIERPGKEASSAELVGFYRFIVFAELEGTQKLSKEVRGLSRL